MMTQPRFTNNCNTHTSQSKGDQVMKFGQLIEYSKKIFCFKNYAENEARKLVPDLLLFFKRAYYEVRVSGLQFGFNIFRQPSTFHTIKTNCIKR